MKFVPRSDFVIVQLDALEKTSRGGILLPESAKEDKCLGKVICVGPGRTNDEGAQVRIHDLPPNDRIIVNKFSGTELNEADRLFLFRESDITCVIK